MLGIPPVDDADIEDVAWALQTAASLWKRNERADAIVWLRRAAQAAGEASLDDRALILARSAAELTELLQSSPTSPPPEPKTLAPNAPTAVPEAPSSRLDIDVEVAEEARDRLPSFPLDPEPAGETTGTRNLVSEQTGRRKKPPLPPSSRTLQAAPPVPEAAPSFQEAHAGMLDPWAEQSSASADRAQREERAAVVTPLAPPPREPREEVEEVVTSARGRAVSQTEVTEIPPKPAAQAPQPPQPPRPPPPLPPRPAAKKPLPVPVPTFARAPSPPPPPPTPVPPPPEPQPEPQAEAAPAPRHQTPTLTHEYDALDAPDPHDLPTPIPPSDELPPPQEVAEQTLAQANQSFRDLAMALPREGEQEVEEDTPPPPPPPPPPDDDEPEGTLVSLAPPPNAAGGAPTPDEVDQFLATVEGLSDLPDDARAEFARSASVHVLAKEEEVAQFALALVFGGELDVSATMVDAPAARIGRGVPLRSRGTTEEGVPLRLIAASDGAVVATWDDEQVEAAFRACPWVEDDLRAASDRVQTLVGVTIGPFGERLDTALREQVASKLEIKSLAPGEVIVEAGKPVPGLVIVGVGEVELVDGGVVKQTLGCGEFLFPDAILGAGPAPLEARAGAGGALVMFGNRMVAQELLVTCPPLLEVFAGM